MNLNFSHKIIFYSTALTVIISHDILCMNQANTETNYHRTLQIPPHPYSPLIIKHSEKEYPEQYSSQQHMIDDFTISYAEQPNDRLGACRTFAATELLGITRQASTLLKISYDSDIIKICNFMQYFYPVEKPALNSLAIYTDETNYIHHMAIVTRESPDNSTLCTVKGKLGCYPNIVEHNINNIIKKYGNRVFFYDLKKEFYDKKYLLQLIQANIQTSRIIRLNLIEIQKLLIKLANGHNITASELHAFDKLSTIEKKVMYLLKNCMGLNVNTRTSKNKQTVTMLATKRNAQELVHLFIAMGADINKQDINGNTALHLAAQYNAKKAMIALVCDEKIDKTIKNNDGLTAYEFALKNKDELAEAIFKV